MIKHEFSRFIIVGVFNTVFGYSIYALFIWIGFNYIWASFFATIIGVLFNFQTIGRLVFKRHNNRLIFRFFLVYGIVFLIGISIIWVLKNTGLNDYTAGLIAIFPNAIISFLLNKFYVYRRIN
ncbi:GtrA family protein [Sulfurovum sp. NBC37-1]|uniref:GtrA family protein n=1 Tax=Sulfurovum sp. (strain NBC37-1) TaxID=387093 RepID=UPI0001587BD8|nr:GtrA family protein [Sulfurovum sp. NBC37-1]BAF73085.1 conserved hypothetical protein [Sulfurovum sp. NBC37-1]